MSRNVFFKISKPFMAIYVFLYRRTGGKFGGKVQGLPVLLLTTNGRKTGKKRVTPLGYFEYDGYYVISASNAGFDTNPAWFYNLKSHRGTCQLNTSTRLMDRFGETFPRIWGLRETHRPRNSDGALATDMKSARLCSLVGSAT